jgi:hypothetical protein
VRLSSLQFWLHVAGCVGVKLRDPLGPKVASCMVTRLAYCCQLICRQGVGYGVGREITVKSCAMVLTATMAVLGDTVVDTRRCIVEPLRSPTNLSRTHRINCRSIDPGRVHARSSWRFAMCRRISGTGYSAD